MKDGCKGGDVMTKGSGSEWTASEISDEEKKTVTKSMDRLIGWKRILPWTPQVMIVDSSVPMSEAQIRVENGEECYKAFEYEDYKYLSAFPVWDDGNYAAICSNDLTHWSLCLSATKDGKTIDVLEIAKSLEESMKGER